MRNKTLNKIIFNFNIYVPINESDSMTKEDMVLDESYDLKDYYPLRDVERPSIEDFQIGDLVIFQGGEYKESELMVVVGHLRPYNVQVIPAARDLAGELTRDYSIFDVYPEDIEVVGHDSYRV